MNQLNDEGNTKTNIDKGARAKKVMQYATESCHKILLLTATPFVNTLYDIENLIAMINNRAPIEESYFYSICANDKSIYTYFKFKISHYEKSQDNINFPERKEGFMNYNKLIKDKGYDQVNYKEMTNEIINAYNNLGILFMSDETANITNSLNSSLTKKQRSYYSGQKKISNNASSNDIEMKEDFNSTPTHFTQQNHIPFEKPSLNMFPNRFSNTDMEGDMPFLSPKIENLSEERREIQK